MAVEAKSEDTQMAVSVVAVEEPTIKAAEKIVVDPSVEEPAINDAEKKVDPSVEEEPIIKDVEKKVDDAAVVVAEVNVEEKKEEEPKTEEVVEEKENESGDGEVILSTPAIEKSSSFREEAKEYSDLKENEKKALVEFKSKLEEAILENKLFKKKDEEQKEKEQQKDIEKPTQQEGDAEKEKSKQEDEYEEKEKSKQESEDEEKEKSTQEGEEAKGKSMAVDSEENKDDKPKQEGGDEEKEKTVEGVEKIVKEESGEEKQKSSPEADEEKIERESEEEKKPDVGAEEKSVEDVVVDKDISIWGVPLLPSKGSEATDVILLKFLRARDFKVNEAFEMLKNTLQWRKDNKIDSILDEDLGVDLGSVAYMDGLDYEGHPICYNMYGIFEDNQLYQKTFGTEEKREQFLRWRFQLMEKGIQKLDFNKGGVSSLLQINDLKNSPGPSRKELRIAMKQAVGLLQDNYPEFVARNIFVNVPFWYYAFNAVLSPFLTQRTKSKFVFARPAKVTETLLRYIPAEQIPLRYGGMKRENDSEFSTEETTVSELTVKAGSTESIEIPAPEVGTTLVWDLIVLGWEVSYKEEFVPTDEGSYTIIVQKAKKMGSHEEPVRNSFRNNEPGKVVLTVDNGSFKKKRVFYRYKTKMSSSS
ncbi:Cellular retinaldehyde binding/alpha-tocopherol transport [Macleaya cordata]|uniref:Cellular retinaldehyde binding/alpha-tocopherol transport n=1 Tax=Macleaya cordata TaxID=56857 RepID=A0A200Q3U1_MACCD|nr:Cellular retinaldehyde binding/alpha-tocopherol transport [Macleaya cordata]